MSMPREAEEPVGDAAAPPTVKGNVDVRMTEATSYTELIGGIDCETGHLAQR
jgi:hypothetical protein